jgi:alpha-glucosidase
LFGLSPTIVAQNLKKNIVKSPDGTITLEVGTNQGKVFYKVSKDAKSILNESYLGFELKGNSFKDNFSIKIFHTLSLMKPGNNLGAKKSM